MEYIKLYRDMVPEDGGGDRTSFYQLAINNVANHINSLENRQLVLDGRGMNAFQASEVLAIVFCKNAEEVILDIVNKK